MDNFRRIEVSTEKMEALIEFLIDNTSGPAEAIAMLHAAIECIDKLNAKNSGIAPSSYEELGKDLTEGLRLSSLARAN